MKTFRASVGVLLAAASVGFAQQPTVNDAGAPVAAPAMIMRTAEELEQLVGPIALYPDALIALILPASSAPADVVLAARHLRDFPNDRSQIEHRAWDESVKSLTGYPDVLQWMDQNLQWTKQLGEAFVAQPADVMQAVQRLRAKARAAGTLIDTPQQQVIAESQVIRIVPAQPDVIYVPRYEPEVVFVDRPVYYNPSFISFGVGVPVGSWLAFECDWYRNTIWVGDRHRRWTGHDWRRPLVAYAPPSAVVVHSSPAIRQWRPPPQPLRPAFSVAYSQRVEVARPSPFGGGNHYSYTQRRDGPVDVRRPATNSLPAVNPQPRTYGANRSTAEYAGPRTPASASTAMVAPPTVPSLRTAPVAAPAPSVTAAPTVAAPVPAITRPNGNAGWNRENRTRSAPPPAAAAPAPLPNVSLPTAGTYHAPATVAAPPPPARVYSRPVPAPAAAPSLPMARPAQPVTGPTVAAPAAPAPAPAATTSAPARSDPPAERRGGRRYDQQEH